MTEKLFTGTLNHNKNKNKNNYEELKTRAQQIQRVEGQMEIPGLSNTTMVIKSEINAVSFHYH